MKVSPPLVPSRYDVRTQGGREKSSAHILRTEEGRCQKKIAYFIYGWILIGSAKICGNGGKISKSNCGIEPGAGRRPRRWSVVAVAVGHLNVQFKAFSGPHAANLLEGKGKRLCSLSLSLSRGLLPSILIVGALRVAREANCQIGHESGSASEL